MYLEWQVVTKFCIRYKVTPEYSTWSVAQVKMNPARSDNMIIQSICLLDQLDKDLNTFAMRVREWYCWHFPELRELVKDNYMFARCAAYIKVN